MTAQCQQPTGLPSHPARSPAYGPHALRKCRGMLSLMLAVGALLITGLPATAQEEPASEKAAKPAKIFTTNEIMNVRMEGPWRTIERNKDKDDVWEGMFRYQDAGGQEIAIPIAITTRGITRKRVCDFPPLRIGFDKEAAKGTAFRGAGNLKLVTHCLPKKSYWQYYITEYLSYRLYNLITPKSYRVQGLDVAYASDAEDARTNDRFAFLIEDPDDVAKRNDLLKLNINDITPSRLDPMETSRFMLFQYLVSNLDWSILGGPKDACCHNARLIGASETATPLYGIPYDLDSSGLVNAHYAAPPANVKARNVRTRVYRGFCAHNESIAAALEEFRAARPAIEALFADEERLVKSQQNHVRKFIAKFYETLDSPEAVKEELIDNCRA